MKPLYHGTIYDFEEIDVSAGKGYKDFGKGSITHSSKSIMNNGGVLEYEITNPMVLWSNDIG